MLGAGDGIQLEGTVREVAFMGASTRILVDVVGGETVMIDRPSTETAEPLRLGDRTTLVIDRSCVRELDNAQTPQGEDQ